MRAANGGHQPAGVLDATAGGHAFAADPFDSLQQVAQRCGLPMVGINLPGHFMLAPAGEDLEVLVDAFNGGEVCFLEEAADRLATLHGVQVTPLLRGSHEANWPLAT